MHVHRIIHVMKQKVACESGRKDLKGEGRREENGVMCCKCRREPWGKSNG